MHLKFLAGKTREIPMMKQTAKQQAEKRLPLLKGADGPGPCTSIELLRQTKGMREEIKAAAAATKHSIVKKKNPQRKSQAAEETANTAFHTTRKQKGKGKII